MPTSFLVNSGHHLTLCTSNISHAALCGKEALINLISRATFPQITHPTQGQVSAVTPDGGCLGLVLRSFGTAKGKLVRTTIFSTERVSSNNTESFLTSA